jgi:hypothetical protein
MVQSIAVSNVLQATRETRIEKCTPTSSFEDEYFQTRFFFFVFFFLLL